MMGNQKLMDQTTGIIVGCIIAGIVVVAALIILITLLVVKSKKGSGNRIKIDDEFIVGLLDILGNKENIEEVTVDNGRLKFKVKDLEIVRLDALKAISTSGVFVTGNVIKTLFKLDSFDIKKAIEKRL